MNALPKRSLLLLGLLALSFVLAACGGRTPTPPQTYTVSGVIVDDKGVAIEGVTLNFGSGVTVVKTDKDGKWTRTGLKGSVTVTPAHNDYTFDPANRPVTKAASDINFTGTKRTTPHEPLNVTIEVDGDIVKGVDPGQQVTLTALVTGTHSAEAQINWYADQGEVSPRNGEKTVIWTAPPMKGTWNVSVYVSGSGESAKHDVDIAVVHTMQCDSGDLNRGDNPCRISTLEQLQAMRHHLHGHFMLDTDIDASDSIFLNDGHGFDPIGRGTSWQIPFSGTLNGNNKTITNLHIGLQGSTSCVGLFGATSTTAQIKNLTLDGVDVSANCVGGLVGQNGGLIENVTVSSVNIEGTDNLGAAGGLVARNSGTIKQATASGVVQGSGTTGGLVGSNSPDGAIEDSTFRFEPGDHVQGGKAVGGLVGSNTGTIIRSRVMLRANHGVTGTNDVGGLVGRMGSFSGSSSPRRVEQSFVYGNGNIIGAENVGGFIGATYDGTVESSYAFVGDVEGTENVGGFIGNLDGFHSTVTETYVITNNVIATDDTPGGFAGKKHGFAEVKRSYWANSKPGVVGTPGSEHKTVVELQQMSTFVGWSPTLWQIPTTGDSYPDLTSNPRD